MSARQQRAPEAARDPESVARAICLRQLAVQPRTRAQLATALARRGVPDDAAASVLRRFTEVGLIDDAAFAAAWVQSRHAGRGLARRALRGELQRRGVDDDTVTAAVDLVDQDTERATAHALIARRLVATRGLAPEVRVRRLAGLLARKGYGPGVALGVVRAALAGEAAREPSVAGSDPDELLEAGDGEGL